MDGDRSLWKQAKAQVPDAVPILDIFHVKLEEILKGKAGRVIGGLKQMATKRGLSAGKRKQLSTALAYLKNNLASMRYYEYLAKGYPIGSGVAEGACRHVVKDRMELTGMRWRVEGTQSMSDIQAVYLNGQLKAFQLSRAQHETQHLYPYRGEVLDFLRSVA